MSDQYKDWNKRTKRDRPILEVRQICKSFPGVRVLKSVNLSIWPGEVHPFMGENAVGKSTLMKILAGVYHPDSGEIILDRKPVHFRYENRGSLTGCGGFQATRLV
jgi:ABC-type sugar transport system ATPase subunit